LGLAIVFQLPLVLYGAYLLYRVPSQPVIPDAATRETQEVTK